MTSPRLRLMSKRMYVVVPSQFCISISGISIFWPEVKGHFLVACVLVPLLPLHWFSPCSSFLFRLSVLSFQALFFQHPDSGSGNMSNDSDDALLRTRLDSDAYLEHVASKRIPTPKMLPLQRLHMSSSSQLSQGVRRVQGNQGFRVDGRVPARLTAAHWRNVDAPVNVPLNAHIEARVGAHDPCDELTDPSDRRTGDTDPSHSKDWRAEARRLQARVDALSASLNRARSDSRAHVRASNRVPSASETVVDRRPVGMPPLRFPASVPVVGSPPPSSRPSSRLSPLQSDELRWGGSGRVKSHVTQELQPPTSSPSHASASLLDALAATQSLLFETNINEFRRKTVPIFQKKFNRACLEFFFLGQVEVAAAIGHAEKALLYEIDEETRVCTLVAVSQQRDYPTQRVLSVPMAL